MKQQIDFATELYGQRISEYDLSLKTKDLIKVDSATRALSSAKNNLDYLQNQYADVTKSAEDIDKQAQLYKSFTPQELVAFNKLVANGDFQAIEQFYAAKSAQTASSTKIKSKKSWLPLALGVGVLGVIVILSD